MQTISIADIKRYSVIDYRSLPIKMLAKYLKLDFSNGLACILAIRDGRAFALFAEIMSFEDKLLAIELHTYGQYIKSKLTDYRRNKKDMVGFNSYNTTEAINQILGGQ